MAGIGRSLEDGQCRVLFRSEANRLHGDSVGQAMRRQFQRSIDAAAFHIKDGGVAIAARHGDGLAELRVVPLRRRNAQCQRRLHGRDLHPIDMQRAALAQLIVHTHEEIAVGRRRELQDRVDARAVVIGGNDLSPGVEHVEHRVDRRTEPATEHGDVESLAFAGGKLQPACVAVLVQDTVERHRCFGKHRGLGLGRVEAGGADIRKRRNPHPVRRRNGDAVAFGRKAELADGFGRQLEFTGEAFAIDADEVEGNGLSCLSGRRKEGHRPDERTDVQPIRRGRAAIGGFTELNQKRAVMRGQKTDGGILAEQGIVIVFSEDDSVGFEDHELRVHDGSAKAHGLDFGAEALALLQGHAEEIIVIPADEPVDGAVERYGLGLGGLAVAFLFRQLLERADEKGTNLRNAGVGPEPEQMFAKPGFGRHFENGLNAVGLVGLEPDEFQFVVIEKDVANIAQPLAGESDGDFGSALAAGGPDVRQDRAGGEGLVSEQEQER
jgi:hypothetical protein